MPLPPIPCVWWVYVCVCSNMKETMYKRDYVWRLCVFVCSNMKDNMYFPVFVCSNMKDNIYFHTTSTFAAHAKPDIFVFGSYVCVCSKYCRHNYYGVATISRMLKNIGLFCKRALQKRPVFCKETCIFKHPTHRSHPIPMIIL